MQNTIAHSTVEALYYSASATGCEVLYLKALLDSLGFKQKKPNPSYEDTTERIEWFNNVIKTHNASSLADRNEPSTLTSGSTLPTQASRMVRCCWSRF